MTLKLVSTKVAVMKSGPVETHPEELAASIQAGQEAWPFGFAGYYTDKDWAKAAQYAFDSEDYSEMEAMIAREETWQDYKEDLADVGGDTRFEDWCRANGREF